MTKRALDIAGSLVGLVLFTPVAIGVAIAIRIAMGSPVRFHQVRLGRNARHFTLVKFRTMSAADGADGQPLPDARRLTGLGRFLRTTSLDELPTLWNVLKGDMSLVGPRPLLPRYLPFFTAAERRRFQARPGITGLAQINGRNLSSWNERLHLDVEYVQKSNVRLDLRILWKTVKLVVTREGAVANPASMMLDLDRERA